MSRVVTLVKFKDGTILEGCYDGTISAMSQWLITKENLQKKYDGNIFTWDDEMFNNFDTNWVEPEDVNDSEEVEIYKDYGYGSYHVGFASKTMKVITSDLSDYSVNWIPIVPEWVKGYFKNK